MPSLTRRTFLGAAAAAVAGPAAAGPPGSLAFADFLPQLGEKDANRRAWWDRFGNVEPQARGCVAGWEYGRLRQVVLTQDKTDWNPDGTVRLTAESLARGALYHEVFHAVLHNSPFRRKAAAHKPNYELYCEGLCNAFQYFMEAATGVRGDWTTRMANWRSKSWGQILSRSEDVTYDVVYGLPALGFIEACASFEAFKRLFAELNEKSVK